MIKITHPDLRGLQCTILFFWISSSQYNMEFLRSSSRTTLYEQTAQAHLSNSGINPETQ
jgi:hypothetical protein